MAEFVVVQAPIDEDLQSFSRYLWQHKMPHRIVKGEGRQLLLVGSEADAKQVAVAYKQYRKGETQLPDIDLEHKQSQQLAKFIWAIKRAPVTLTFLVLSIVGYFVVYLDHSYSIVGQLTFFKFEKVGRDIVFSLPEGEYWRLITPIFLHFGVLHIVFNGLWLLDLGRRCEMVKGSWKTFFIILLIGLGSNVTQSVYTGGGIFGGMSGVIYGLLGYGWIWSYLCPEKSLQIPQSVINFMLVWLVLCMFGFARLFGVGAVANAAHVGGLVIGILLGLGAGVISRSTKRE